MFGDDETAAGQRGEDPKAALRREKRTEESLWRHREQIQRLKQEPDRPAPGRTRPLDANPQEMPAPSTDEDAERMRSIMRKGQMTRHNLDGAAMISLFRQVEDTYTRELERQEPNRQQQAIDEDFFDNIQWDEEDAALLEERGQVPLVFNIIATPVKWVLGTEKRGRSDFKVLPRRKEDAKPAEKKSQLLKYLSDVNRLPFARSDAFEDAVKVGVGWLDDGWQGDDSDGEPLYSRYENWRNVLWDSSATEKDLSDARYLHRHRWFDLDIATALFPERADLLAGSVETAITFSSAADSLADEPMDSIEAGNMNYLSGDTHTHSYRERVRLIETWFTLPRRVDVMSGGMFAGELFDESSPGHVDELNNGTATLARRMRMQMHVGIWCSGGWLWLSPSPYRHNRYPLTPIWGHRRGRDRMPYGMIRGLRDIQADVNKRASKALHILNSSKVIMDEGAVDDIEELREEVARPDSIIVKSFGKELKIDVDREMTQWQMQMMQSHIAMAERQSGVNDENLGRQTNAHSGVAIERRQDQGAMVTTNFFDNLRYAAQVQGEKQLANIEQFMSAKKQFRITNMRGKPDFIDINDGLPENEIVRSKADFVISEADWRATMRQNNTAELMETIGKLPGEMIIQMLDLMVEEMDVTNREEIVKRIRAMNGQRDPDADPNDITPEEMARAEQAAKQAQMQEQGVLAEIRRLLATAAKDEAAAERTRSQLVNDNVAAQTAALTAAQTSMAMPQVVPVADFILDQAGFESKTDKESKGRQIAEAMQGAQQAAAAQAAPPEGEEPPPEGEAPMPPGIMPPRQPQPQQPPQA